MTFEEFIDNQLPRMREVYAIWKNAHGHPHALLGVRVTSVRSGFSGSAGTQMIIDSIQDDGSITLVADPEAGVVKLRNSKWGSHIDTIHKDVGLTDPKLIAVLWDEPMLIPTPPEPISM